LHAQRISYIFKNIYTAIEICEKELRINKSSEAAYCLGMIYESAPETGTPITRSIDNYLISAKGKNKKALLALERINALEKILLINLYLQIYI
jgi:hypothetical protein